MLHLSQLSELMKHRRTIKPIDARGQPNYLEKSIPPEVLDQLLQNANWAPTHGLTEPWRFTIYQGSALNELAHALSEIYTLYRAGEKFNQTKHDKLTAYPRHSTVAIALGMQRHAGKIPAEEEVIAVACAVQNLHLSASAAGLGGFWSSSPIYDLPETRHFFGFNGSEDRCLGIFYLGYPKNQWPTRKRDIPEPIHDKITWR